MCGAAASSTVFHSVFSFQNISLIDLRTLLVNETMLQVYIIYTLFLRNHVLSVNVLLADG